MSQLQQLRHLGCAVVVCGEHVVDVLLETVLFDLPALLDLAGHLLLNPALYPGPSRVSAQTTAKQSASPRVPLSSPWT